VKQIRYLAVLTCFALVASGWSSSTFAQEPSVKMTHFATGLVNSRGLKFGPDRNLYVAETGFPTGDIMVAPVGLAGDCSVGEDVPGKQYIGSTTGSRISRIDADGNVTTFVDNLPSDQIAGLDSGVADVAFIGDTMYAIYAGAGCSHGVPSIPNAVTSAASKTQSRISQEASQRTAAWYAAGQTGGCPTRS
jgi:hypothetical protein